MESLIRHTCGEEARLAFQDGSLKVYGDFLALLGRHGWVCRLIRPKGLNLFESL